MVPEIEDVRDIDKIIGYAMKQKKSARKAPQVILQQGVFTANPDTMLQSFVAQQQLNPTLKNPFKHFVISFDKSDGDKINDHNIHEYLHEYMDELYQQSKGKIDLKPSQYLLVRHYDSQHIHYHLVVNRVLGYRQTVKEGNLFISNKYAYRALAERWGLKLTNVLQEKRALHKQGQQAPKKAKEKISRDEVIYDHIIPTFVETYHYVIRQSYPPNHDLIGELIDRLSKNLTILDFDDDYYLKLNIKTTMLIHNLNFSTTYIDPSLTIKKLIHSLETKQPIQPIKRTTFNDVEKQVIKSIEKSTDETSFYQNMKREGLIVANLKPKQFMIHSKGKRSRTFKRFGKKVLSIYFDLKKEDPTLSFEEALDSINYLDKTIQQTLPQTSDFDSFLSQLKAKGIRTTVKKDQPGNIVGLTFHHNQIAVSGTKLNYKYAAKRLINTITKNPIKEEKNTPRIN